MKQYLIGNSIDIHKLIKKESNVFLGGISFKEKYEVIAHSDGDVILHAVSESILGALSLGDLGEHFSDIDPKNKDMSSNKILEYTLNLMDKKGYQISNIDITLISEHIFMKEKKETIKKNLVELLKTNNVSLKATRWEEDRLFIQCNSIVLLEKKK